MVFEASSELEPIDPRRGGSVEQLRTDQPIGPEGGHSSDYYPEQQSANWRRFRLPPRHIRCTL
jgi:hypothetical protein